MRDAEPPPAPPPDACDSGGACLRESRLRSARGPWRGGLLQPRLPRARCTPRPAGKAGTDRQPRRRGTRRPKGRAVLGEVPPTIISRRIEWNQSNRDNSSDLRRLCESAACEMVGGIPAPARAPPCRRQKRHPRPFHAVTTSDPSPHCGASSGVLASASTFGSLSSSTRGCGSDSRHSFSRPATASNLGISVFTPHRFRRPAWLCHPLSRTGPTRRIGASCCCFVGYIDFIGFAR